MSENTPFGFGKFVPGFDFLQNITKGAQGLPQMPGLANWVAPTLNVEEVEKRISELKAVMFWLDQNRQALNATIQALEVQKMTLATLRGMNVSMTQLSEALTAKPAARAAGRDKPEPASEAAEAPVATAAKARAGSKGEAGGNGAAAIDPLQWWSALTQQFQEIAANALKDGAQKAAAGAEIVAANARPATASAAPATAARKSAPAKSPARKSRSK
jgi:hypothetical protein